MTTRPALYQRLGGHARRSLGQIHRLFVWLVLAPVYLYRAVLSPLKRTPSCRYLPTCSEYAIEAVRTRGIVVGGLLGVGRLLRCNPLFHGGHDPVPGSARHACHHEAEEHA